MKMKRVALLCRVSCSSCWFPRAAICKPISLRQYRQPDGESNVTGLFAGVTVAVRKRDG
jgi:hypothetical protein